MPSRVAVKALREAYGLSQAEFAKLLPTDTRTVRRWELNEVSPSPLAIARLRELQKQVREDDSSDAEVDLAPPASSPRRRASGTPNDAPLPLGMPGGAR